MGLVADKEAHIKDLRRSLAKLEVDLGSALHRHGLGEEGADTEMAEIEQEIDVINNEIRRAAASMKYAAQKDAEDTAEALQAQRDEHVQGAVGATDGMVGTAGKMQKLVERLGSEFIEFDEYLKEARMHATAIGRMDGNITDALASVFNARERLGVALARALWDAGLGRTGPRSHFLEIRKPSHEMTLVQSARFTRDKLAHHLGVEDAND